MKATAISQVLPTLLSSRLVIWSSPASLTTDLQNEEGFLGHEAVSKRQQQTQFVGLILNVYDWRISQSPS
jgi:hypothetical protein